MVTTLYTVGHGRRSMDELIALLTSVRIEQLVDVRANPHSARHPWFNKEPLQSELGEAGIGYRWFGQELGGRREQRHESRHVALRAKGLRAFADYMETTDFNHGTTMLLELVRLTTTAIMCAETSPANCHRGIISDYLTIREIRVLHLMGAESIQPHVLHRAVRNESGRPVYDQKMQRDLDLK